MQDVASAFGVDAAEVSRLLLMAFLSPKIIDAITNGTQPVELTTQRLSRVPELPPSWAEQHRMLLG